ncbi:pelargonidin 3-O-(6-caffeoylglucoside) 5-O-(6-O-malonylglucoside) 4'''-malonyltransferase-like [Rutidosis leptorrhynchoides]|uniref:pelargonidin 3-O-(6-caffeoylglucoside) 5-O-(6-O-malonylglucoside) 4'''-malonyltransferase-like n=1 Tax=Rutidosis leptorrhynchoides TaxID=125765 RepID=UPI003A9A4800
MTMKVEKQSLKFIKPHIPTPETNRTYKLGFTDELALFMNVAIIVFFSPNLNHENKNSILQLQESLSKTLTRFYPLAGRYVDKTLTIDCNDEGVEFIHATVNVKLDEQVVGSKADPNLVNQFVSFKTPMMYQLTHPLLLSIQVTNFECGGVAIGVNASHKVVDASTLCTFLNEWAAINREENNIEFTGSGFSSTLIFPGRGLSLVKSPSMSDDDKAYGEITKRDGGNIIFYDDMLRKYTRIKRLFNESDISNIREYAARTSSKSNIRRWSKVQLVGSILSKAFIDVDRAIHTYSRESVVFQAINLRGKFASFIPKDSCGNITAKNVTKIGTLQITTLELANLLSDSIKVALNNYSKVFHDSEEGKSMVLNSLLETRTVPESTNVIAISSWCKFPFYKANFGFGKPIWVAPATLTTQNIICLMDDARGNGVECSLIYKTCPYVQT